MKNFEKFKSPEKKEENVDDKSILIIKDINQKFTMNIRNILIPRNQDS